MVSSWATDMPEGFTQAQVDLVVAVLPALALVFMLETAQQTARTLVTTYLGQDAAERVLAGNIVRGPRGEDPRRGVVQRSRGIHAPVGSHRCRAGMLALLNDVCRGAGRRDRAAWRSRAEVHRRRHARDLPAWRRRHAACARALAAAHDYRARLAALKRARSERGLAVPDTHLALHLGDLLYGNVGSPRRLDFTVLGPAVNEAARIEALCGSLEQSVIVSSAFAAAAAGARHRLVSLGRYALKGIARPQEMFTLDADA